MMKVDKMPDITSNPFKKVGMTQIQRVGSWDRLLDVFRLNDVYGGGETDFSKGRDKSCVCSSALGRGDSSRSALTVWCWVMHSESDVLGGWCAQEAFCGALLGEWGIWHAGELSLGTPLNRKPLLRLKCQKRDSLIQLPLKANNL